MHNCTFTIRIVAYLIRCNNSKYNIFIYVYKKQGCFRKWKHPFGFFDDFRFISKSLFVKFLPNLATSCAFILTVKRYPKSVRGVCDDVKRGKKNNCCVFLKGNQVFQSRSPSSLPETLRMMRISAYKPITIHTLSIKQAIIKAIATNSESRAATLAPSACQSCHSST